MRGLFFKIFVIFWIAQSLIFVISTALILQHRFPRPDVFFDLAFKSLPNEARDSLHAYEAGGCTALRAYADAHGQAIALADETGTDVCSGAKLLDDQKSTQFPNHVTGRQFGQEYIWTVPVVSTANRQYIFTLSQPHTQEQRVWYQDLLHFAFPQLPVAIAVGGATTFVLVLIFTRPVIRLRRAARELAHGNLNVRVHEPSREPSFFERDEFRGLTHDFNHMAERLESLVNAQRLLLRDVSHELRSPLARLSVALELAREDAAPEMATHLGRIERETERLNQLIGQLLTLSSMEAIEAIDTFEQVPLNELVAQMTPDAQYEAAQRGCSIVLQEESDCVIAGNRQLLYRALENIVRNAIRFTNSGSAVEIRLAMEQNGAAQNAVVEVSDRGPGIPEAELSAIFRPFYRVDRARSQDTGGSGVGLAIVDRTVKLHHGELSAFNRKDGGATIRVVFPCAKTAHSSNV